ncbi:glycosyltransferase family 2 protein [Muricoccus radiodurans]|uniref:glycosyltransferase family 2 protein n=1 Tax=Muricoccus radiodurans TaxID=2231721 RepID=UPI003CED0FD6
MPSEAPDALGASPPPAVSVVICTYNRPERLRNCLRSLLASLHEDGLQSEIVVVDNTERPYAEAVLRDFAPEVPARVVLASPPNISVARNAGIRAARGPLIAFLDDDQLVESGWLAAMLGTERDTGADVVLGAVIPQHLGGPPPRGDWGLYSRLLDRPSGTIISLNGPNRPDGFAFGTGNSLWRRDTTLAAENPFDPEFGACGGEDYELYLRSEQAGRRFAWCADGKVLEAVPHDRLRLGYLVRRAFSGAQVYAAATIRNSASPVRTAASIMARGAAQAVLHVLGAPVLCLIARLRPSRAAAGARGASSGREHCLDAMLSQAAFGLGKLVWWRKIPLYRMGPPPVAAAEPAGPQASQ